jgi:hypothetical protein
LAVYDPALWYRVKVSRYVPAVRNTDFRPKFTYFIKGDVVAELDGLPGGSAVASAELDQTRNPH